MSIAAILQSLPTFGQRAVGELTKPTRAKRQATRRPSRPALRTYTPMPVESLDGHDVRLEFERAERACLKAAVYRCQARLPDVCMVKAVTAHHKRLRSAGGGNELSNLLAVCRGCHKALHNSPALAAKLGHTKQRKVVSPLPVSEGGVAQ